ncbi:hypothetical protein [Microcoleus sp. FACHB-831]|nr:hypothetical protein [Microcoleus sp. FACHB-831]
MGEIVQGDILRASETPRDRAATLLYVGKLGENYINVQLTVVFDL